MPLSVRVGSGSIPLPAAAGALLAIAVWASVVLLHTGGLIIGTAWLLVGAALYVAYRKSGGRSLTKRFTVPAELLRERVKQARQFLARAKEVGEEYEGVEVATAMVRGRTAGQAIVGEARRRGVEAIVLAAEEPTRVSGGALLGGRGRARDRFVGETTRYVVEKSPCKVILTAPPSEDGEPAPAGP